MKQTSLKIKPIKHEAEYNEAMIVANEHFRASDGKEMVDKCPYHFTSNFADVYWITAHSLYHTGRAPFAFKKSRGHSWLVDFPGNGVLRTYVDKPDHREGIRFEKP